jgi:NAD(P)-dependent dehydrogenase (short-subunit alcohol dehydrogenase family)
MKTVLITGVGRGIGLKLVEEFLKRGYAVIGTVRDDAGKQRAEQTAAALGKAVETHIVELTEQASVERLRSALADRTIDILINNAGIRGENDQTYISLDLDEWLNILQVNTIAPMRVTLALLPNLLQAEQAKIVTISSAMGSMARERNDAIAYRSSKTAVNKAMQCLAVDLRPKQVGVYLMHPGWVRTDMGGPEGEVSAEQSASGLADTIVNFDLDDSGTFWNYDGEALEW